MKASVDGAHGISFTLYRTFAYCCAQVLYELSPSFIVSHWQKLQRSTTDVKSEVPRLDLRCHHAAYLAAILVPVTTPNDMFVTIISVVLLMQYPHEKHIT